MCIVPGSFDRRKSKATKIYYMFKRQIKTSLGAYTLEYINQF